MKVRNPCRCTMGVIVPKSQKGSVSLDPAHSESVLQTGIGPLDSDHDIGALGFDLVDQKMSAINSLPTGVPNLGCSKRRDFIQVNILQSGKHSLWRKLKVCSPKTKGRLAI